MTLRISSILGKLSYLSFEKHSPEPIIGYSVEINEDSGEIVIPNIPEVEKELLLIMEKAWATYSPFTAAALVNKTYEPDSPWAKCTDHDSILDENIKKYFLEKIQEYLNG